MTSFTPSPSEHVRALGEIRDHPGLVLLLGPANSGKMGRLLDWWRARLALDPVVVVPTGPDAVDLTNEMIRRTGALIGAAPAGTFDGLVAEVLGENPRYAGILEEDLILRRVPAREDLPILGPMTRFPGTLTALMDVLRSFGESGRTPGQIVDLLRAWGRCDATAAGLSEDLVRVVLAYEESKRSLGLCDRPAAMSAARDRLGAWARPVAFYGFTSFTTGQRLFIEALAARAPVLLALSYDGSSPAEVVDRSEVEHWRSFGCRVIESSARTQAYSSPTIAFLARSFMNPSPEALPPGERGAYSGVKFLLASGRRNEAELAAQHVAALVREGFDLERIAVVVRSVDSWSSLLSQVFRSCGIPFRLDVGSRLRSTGLGHALLSALEGFVPGDAERPSAHLRSPYSGVDLPEVVAGGGEEGPWVDPVVVTRLATEMLCRGVRGLSPLSREVEEDARAFRTIAAAMERLERLSPGGEDSSWLRLDAVLPALERLVVPPGPVSGQRAVQVLSPHRARARRFDAVFVLGLTEGEFPARGGPSSLLSQSQRMRIDALGGGGVFPPEVDRESALFAGLVSRAWQLLYLSARNADDDGGEATPSRFWSQSRRLLRLEEGEVHRRTAADQVFHLGWAPTLRHHRRSCAAWMKSSAVDAASSSILNAVMSWDRPPALLSEPAVRAELGARESFTPSEIETHLTCPFMWFVRQIVRDDLVYREFDERVYGQLLHSCLGRVYGELSKRGILPLGFDHLARALEVVPAAVDRLMEDGAWAASPSELRLARWRLARDVEAVLRLDCARGAPTVAADLELSVGGGAGVDVGGLRIRGRIDRVDADPQKSLLFVIDYKSGGVPATTVFGTPKAIQLPLYLLALKAERPEAEVIGGAYLSVRDRRYAGFVVQGAAEAVGVGTRGVTELDAGAEEEIYNITLDNAWAAVQAIRGGDIRPVRDNDCPDWCGYGPICRTESRSHRR